MMQNTSRYLAALALGAMVLGSVVVVGCSRDEAPEPPKADPPSVYMKDSVFTNALARQRAERREILASRERVLEQVRERVDAMREKMPEASDEEIKKVLEQDPEWQSLMARANDIGRAYEENRQTTTKIVGERLAPKKQNLK